MKKALLLIIALFCLLSVEAKPKFTAVLFAKNKAEYEYLKGFYNVRKVRKNFDIKISYINEDLIPQSQRFLRCQIFYRGVLLGGFFSEGPITPYRLLRNMEAIKQGMKDIQEKEVSVTCYQVFPFIVMETSPAAEYIQESTASTTQKSITDNNN